MKRRHFTFKCDSETLVGTLEGNDGSVGLLMLSGGNEVRSGAFSGQATLAAEIAAAGFPVFRFDRRGVGDSSGTNCGFRGEEADITAAIGEFRLQCPSLEAIVGFGNCDAASALMFQSAAQCDALALANPWTFDEENAQDLPPEAIRERYAGKLSSPREWRRLVRGEISLGKIISGLGSALRPSLKPSSLTQELRQGIEAFHGDVRFLIAGRDRTGQAFRSAWGQDDRIVLKDGADHAFSAPEDREWLAGQLLSALEEQARKLDMS